MKNEMQYDIEKTRKPVTIEKLQDDLQKLQHEVRSLEVYVATLANTNIIENIKDMDSGEPPHHAAGKLQRCTSCKHMRMPHKSNAHYTCTARHAIVEPTWTCGLFHDKKGQSTSEADSYVGH